MPNLVFKYNWFEPIRPALERHVPHGRLSVLEIGSFEGLSTHWFLSRGAVVTAVDHFAGGSDQQELDIAGLFPRFANNVQEYSDRLVLHKCNSWQVLHKLPSDSFDIAFVDGSHESDDVLHDVLESYRVTKPGGRLLLDDYTWEPQRESRPAVAIDAFLLCFKRRVRVLETGRLLVAEKLC